MTAAGVAAFLGRRVIFAKLGAGILWACYAASVLLGSGAGTYNLGGQLVLPDHLAFYTAARLIRDGRPEKVYDYEFVTQYQAELFPGRWDSLEAFRNPPFYALLYLTTAGLPFAASAWVWAAVSLALIAGSVRLLVRPPSPPIAMGGLSPIFWALTFYPVFTAISYGQNTPLSLFVFAVTYRLLAAGRPFLAGLAAGLLWFKPPLLLGLVVWGLLDLRRLWPAAVGVVITGAALVAGSYPLVPEVWHGFVGTLTKNVAFDNFEQFKMHNPVAFWRLLLPGVPDRVRWGLAAASSLAAVGAFAWLGRRRRADLPVMFGAAVYLTLWASPHSLIYEWALLVVPGVLWLRERGHRPEWWFLLYFVAWVVLFASTHLTEGQLIAHAWLMKQAGTEWPPVAVQLSVPVLAWVGWTAARLLRESGTRPPEDGDKEARNDAKNETA
jgi:hypothetical protein